MDNFNKVISFVLGLVVVVVLLVILTGRFNLRERFLPLQGDDKKAAATATPTPKTTAKNQQPSGTKGGQNTTGQPAESYEYHSYKNPAPAGTTKGGQPTQQGATGQTKGGTVSAQPNVNTIPATGASTLLIPVAFTSLLAGAYLRKRA